MKNKRQLKLIYTLLLVTFAILLVIGMLMLFEYKQLKSSDLFSTVAPAMLVVGIVMQWLRKKIANQV